MGKVLTVERCTSVPGTRVEPRFFKKNKNNHSTRLDVQVADS